MTRVHPASAGASAVAGGFVAGRGLADWVCLAAMPTFAVMALLTALGGGPADMLCPAGSMSALSGMVPMYALMSAFHAPPWLRLISRRRG